MIGSSPTAVSKVLPRMVGFAIVYRSFQHPNTGAGGIAHLDDHVRHLEQLWEQNYIYFNFNSHKYRYLNDYDIPNP